MTVETLRALLAELPGHHEITAGAAGYPEQIADLTPCGPAQVQLVVGTTDD